MTTDHGHNHWGSRRGGGEQTSGWAWPPASSIPLHRTAGPELKPYLVRDAVTSPADDDDEYDDENDDDDERYDHQRPQLITVIHGRSAALGTDTLTVEFTGQTRTTHLTVRRTPGHGTRTPVCTRTIVSKSN